ncbi:Hsp20/alpha crystallin family protein [Paenibacillus sp.]|uniref:Hsp20/alpha crystallin family protein n=1 Tax=Paenibacillus sp. TaxID=58172 RepID=UPI00281286BD|nr:Hsp20/alpha crystallin family protein [Paenibacillus sp.]
MSDGQWNKESWDTFKKWMQDSLSFGAPQDDFRWVTDYVDGILKEALAAPERQQEKVSAKESRSSSAAGRPLSYELFQTHRHIIVRFVVPERIKARQLRVYAAVQRLRVEGLPNGGKQTVALPALVYADTARALFKDGVLQIKLMKRPSNERFEEVFVRFE